MPDDLQNALALLRFVLQDDREVLTDRYGNVDTEHSEYPRLVAKERALELIEDALVQAGVVDGAAIEEVA